MTAGFSAADSKGIASYKLTMETTKKEVNPENVKFMFDHAELEAMRKEMEMLEK
jgi:hypothetical protein